MNDSLRVDGLVKNPQEFSYAELRDISKQKEITGHFCIQGWLGVVEWGASDAPHPRHRQTDTTNPICGFYSFAGS